MAEKCLSNSKRSRDRLFLLALVLLPFLPELLIQLTAAIAVAAGCQADQQSVCLIGHLAVSDLINLALSPATSWIARGTDSAIRIGVLYLTVAVWLSICYYFVYRGWTRRISRLLVGSIVGLVFALFPYAGPMLAITNIAVRGSCEPNAGSDGRCAIFGGDVSYAHDAVVMSEPTLLFGGALLALSIFALFTLVVLVKGLTSSRAN